MSPPKAMEFVLVGAGALLRYCAAEIVRRGHRVVEVFTDDAVTGASVSADLGAPVEPLQVLCSSRRPVACDVLLSTGNLRKLPHSALSGARVAAVNYHDGPLPRYPGLNAPSWALANGEREHGMTWHLMTDAVDAGAVLVQRRFAVADDDTSFTLGARCYEAAIESLEPLLDRLEQGNIAGTSTPLDSQTRHLAHDKPRLLGLLDWSQSAASLVDLARALDFGPYANPLCLPKLLVGETVFVVRKVELGLDHVAPPGLVSGIDEDGWYVGCAGGAVRLSQFLAPDGARVSGGDLARATSTATGRVLHGPADPVAIEALARRLAPHEPFWSDRLSSAKGPNLPRPVRVPGAVSVRRVPLPPLSASLRGGGDAPAALDVTLLAALAASLGLKSAESDEPFDVAYRDETVARLGAGAEAWVSAYVPLRVGRRLGKTFEQFRSTLVAELEDIHRHVTFPVDLPLRLPSLTRAGKADGPPWSLVAVERCDSLEARVQHPCALLTLVLPKEGGACWAYDEQNLGSAELERIESAFVDLLCAISEGRDEPFQRTLAPVASTARGPLLAGSLGCIHALIERAAEAHPDRAAVHARDGSLTYAELDRKTNQLARYLLGRGLQHEGRVAICMDRSIDMVIAVVAVLKAGGCYVPVDPTYPAERTGFMVRDSQAAILLTNASARRGVPHSAASVISLDADAPAIGGENPAPVPGIADGASLAYLIYTSGSSGQPKGVMLEHRNVTSFFDAMDECCGGREAGVWLAVTSLSFDISVLELLWTLTRGFTVVVGEGIGQMAPARRPAKTRVDFSLFYFSSNATQSTDRYRLLLEGARFADRNDFLAVWTPERHFHDFGGLYPNPAVTGAALAAITRHVGIRAGSVVMPLHHPIRVAEEWAVVDNVSSGRVGISFASGWQPNDFVLRPENFADNKARMLDGIETVRALWRGESRVFPGPDGRQVELHTLPRPIQAELPVWLTAAGNPETFRIAGERGYRVLTHLLGQSVEELAQKVATYRDAWRLAGHAGAGHVTLMLHTFVAEDDDLARARVRGPLKDYLRTSVSLIKDFAATFPALRKRPDGRNPDFNTLSEEELDALLEYSFERYYASSGLLGTPEKCRALVDRVAALGVNEVACLIDFGVDTDAVLASLDLLNDVRASFASDASEDEFEGHSVSRLIERYGVTHMQCTPSLALILLADESARKALGSLRWMLVGGEALPVPLARDLACLVGGQVLNMYGPTEATVWSTSHRLSGGEDRTVPIGRPLANTVIVVADEQGQSVPPGIPGEILIGGHGVARGYHERPDLTRDRFVEDTQSGLHRSRLYRTGDRGVFAADGSLEFLGRMDHQIKIRGHRVELGEIEAVLARHAGVRECAVAAAPNVDGDLIISAHVVSARGPIDAQDLRAHMRQLLPDVMIPSRFVMVDSLPHTPNGKVDRGALSRRETLEQTSKVGHPQVTASTPALENRIAEIWRDVLGLESVGIDEHFFELGGHSLSAVQVHSRLKALNGRPLAITDLFRFPTVRTLAAFIGADDESRDAGASTGQARARARRQALARRHAGDR